MAIIKNPLTIVKSGTEVNALQYIRNLGNNAFAGAVFDQNKYTFNMPRVLLLASAPFGGPSPCLFNGQNMELVFNLGQPTSLGSFWYNLSNSSTTNSIDKITINADLSQVTTYQYAFYVEYSKLMPKHLDMEFDFTSLANSYGVPMWTNQAGPALQDFRCKPNTLSYSWSCRSLTAINNNTLIQIANCLKDGITGQTLTLASSKQSTVTSIMGTVSTDGGVNTFTASDSGTVALSDFITTYKGWTLVYQ